MAASGQVGVRGRDDSSGRSAKADDAQSHRERNRRHCHLMTQDHRIGKTPVSSVSNADRQGPEDDREIARRICGGDEQAFVLLMQKCNRSLYRTARSMLKDDSEAEDATQESYVRAYQAMKSFRGDSKLATWLTRIVVNECNERLRKRTRGAEVVAINQALTVATAAQDAAQGPSAQEPEPMAIRAQTRRLLEAKIDALPDAFRTVFVLRAVEEFTVEETAECLGIPEATVRTRLFRARSALREALASEFDLAIEEAFGFAGKRCDRTVAAVLARLRRDGTVGNPS